MDRPSWVQPAQQMSTGFIAPPTKPPQGASTPMLGSGDAAGSNVAGTNAPTASNPSHTNANAWDGIGLNTNQNQTPDPFQSHVTNVGNPVDASGANLPPNMQQMLSAFMNMGGQGFQGFQPVAGNPFANLGQNINQWGRGSTASGVYGGT